METVYNYVMEKYISVFKSRICHSLKEMGDIDFMLDVIKKDRIRTAWDNKSYFEAFYTLAMLDYLSQLHNIPLCTRYNDIRERKLSEPVYPTGLLLLKRVTRDHTQNTPLSEFQKYNIYEYNIRDVC